MCNDCGVQLPERAPGVRGRPSLRCEVCRLAADRERQQKWRNAHLGESRERCRRYYWTHREAIKIRRIAHEVTKGDKP
jgi:hypothetical protein